MKSIVLVSVYFGELPYYFSLFKESANYNKDVNWIIFTDVEETHEEENIKFINFTLKEFNKLASQKMALDINIQKPYKLCDFKPAYGKIFEDYLKAYDFWGHCDLDIIWGDIRKFIPEKVLEENDIISADRRYLCGVFSIYKNTERLKNIYKDLRAGYNTLIKTQEYEGLDEVDYNIIKEKNPSLKIFSQHQCGNAKLDLQRYGKNRTPAHWEKGKMIVESYLTDYPGQKAFCGFGAETMFFHVREKMQWHIIDTHTKTVSSLKTPNYLCKNDKIVCKELFFNVRRSSSFVINKDLPEDSPVEKIDKLLLIHTATKNNHNNYSHWLTEAMPNILSALEEIKDKDCKIAFYSARTLNGSLKFRYFDEQDLRIKYINEYLEVVGIKDRVLPIEKNTIYKVNNFIDFQNYVRNRGSVSHPDQNIKNIRDFCLGLDLGRHCPPVGKKIYAARKGSRSVSKAAEEMILSYGFKKLYMEDYSVLEQAAIFHNADMIISPHGAQLANLIFCRSGTQIVELSNGWNYTCFPDIAIKTMAGNMGFHRQLWRKRQTQSFQSLKLNFLHVFEEHLYENDFVENSSMNNPKYIIKDQMDMSKNYDCKDRKKIMKSNKQKNVSPCLKRLEIILR